MNPIHDFLNRAGWYFSLQ